MTDIRGLSTEERVHKLVLETSLRHSVLGQYQQPTGVLTDNDLYEIFSKIEHRTYYTVDMPRFEIMEVIDGEVMTKSIACCTIEGVSIEELVNQVLMNGSDKYFIYYNISLSSLNNKYSIRGAFIDDPVIKRDNKINIVLGE